MIEEQPGIGRQNHDCNPNRTSFMSRHTIRRGTRRRANAGRAGRCAPTPSDAQPRTRAIVLGIYGRLGPPTPQVAIRIGRLWRLGLSERTTTLDDGLFPRGGVLGRRSVGGLFEFCDNTPLG